VKEFSRGGWGRTLSGKSRVDTPDGDEREEGGGQRGLKSFFRGGRKTKKEGERTFKKTREN